MHPRIVARPPVNLWGAHAPRVLFATPSSRTLHTTNTVRSLGSSNVRSDWRGRQSQHARARALPGRDRAFTLIELLVVIAIIIILAGLLYPAYNAVQSQAKRTQAKNDLTQIVNAVNAFYTEYGKYPTSLTSDTAATWGPANAGNTNNLLFNELRACTATDTSCTAAAVLNTRQIVFISPPIVKDPNSPKSGIGTTTGQGQYFDPSGTPYNVRIDADYNNSVSPNPYSQGAGVDPIQQGVIAWSYGADQTLGTNNDGVYKNLTTGAQSDDIISWQ